MIGFINNRVGFSARCFWAQLLMWALRRGAAPGDFVVVDLEVFLAWGLAEVKVGLLGVDLELSFYYGPVMPMPTHTFVDKEDGDSYDYLNAFEALYGESGTTTVPEREDA